MLLHSGRDNFLQLCQVLSTSATFECAGAMGNTGLQGPTGAGDMLTLFCAANAVQRSSQPSVKCKRPSAN